jgi:choline dehydrogenase-like flavoprotein
MFIDARSVPPGTAIDTEVCIVGAGAAGITLAREFISSGFRVALLESGDTDFEEKTQALYGGKSIGRRYFDPMDIRLRLRFFGGTTNHWGGWCALPEPLDFETRAGVPYSGWPFTRAHLDPWYRRAHDVLQLGPFDYAPLHWGLAESDIPAPFRGPHFLCQILQVSPPTRFAPDYGPALREAQRLTVYMNANALRFETDETNSTVQRLSVGVLPDARLVFRARIYVLATGGIENARLLLLSGHQGASGLGNGQDLVGRFFLPHIEYPGGSIFAGGQPADLKIATGDEGTFFQRDGIARKFVPYVCLSEKTRRERNLPQLRFLLSRPLIGGSNEADETVRGLSFGMRDIEDGQMLHKAQFEFIPFSPPINVYCSSEQMPNPESRIGLSSEKDALGQQMVTVNWQPTKQDKRGMLAGHELFGAEIGRTGFGRFWSSVPSGDEDWPRRMFGNQHHIGTTRMHRDPRSGVVDENCRVHAVSNLYVAGSSVFPTQGTNNPTLTIVALALRLADHIKDSMK